jgi:hypothetical protein
VRVPLDQRDTLASLASDMEPQTNSGDISPTENVPSERGQSVSASGGGTVDGEAPNVRTSPTTDDDGRASASSAGESACGELVDVGTASPSNGNGQRRRSVSFSVAPPKVIEFVRYV